MPDKRTLVLVGHCGPDRFMLKSAIGRVFPDAPIEMANDSAELTSHLSPDSVLLINRVLDGDFDTTSGIELIGQLAAGDAPPVTLLISNYSDAQAEAVAAGARPGFGKSDLYEDKTAEILREAITT